MIMKFKLMALAITVLMFASVLSGCAIADSDSSGENERLNNLISELNEDMKGLNNLVDKLKEEIEGYKTSIKEFLEKEKEKEEEKEEEPEIIKATGSSAEPGTWTLLDSYSYDLDKDGTDEAVNLYTSSLKDEKGNMMWDDGQYFLLEMVDGGIAFELFNEYVQIGRVYFAVNDDDTTGIILLVSTFAGIRLESFTYVPDETAFEHKQVFGSGDLNIVYNSMPWD